MFSWECGETERDRVALGTRFRDCFSETEIFKAKNEGLEKRMKEVRQFWDDQIPKKRQGRDHMEAALILVPMVIGPVVVVVGDSGCLSSLQEPEWGWWMICAFLFSPSSHTPAHGEWIDK